MKTHTKTFWIIAILVSLGIAIPALYFSTAEAVYSRTVGTISVTRFVPNEGAGNEFVTLAFSGILGQDSVANLNGWSIKNESGFVFDLSNIELTNKETVKICEAEIEDSTCQYYFEESDVFPDEEGALHVVARDGTPVVYIPYQAPVAGETLSSSGNYIDDVYTSGDKISICEAGKKSDLKLRNINVRRLDNNFSSMVSENIDIVPPFVYEANKTLAFHPGINWPAGKNILESSCQ